MIHTDNNEILCPKCMRPQSPGGGGSFCEHCGSPLVIENKPYQLRPGTVIANRYIVGSVLGAGGFGITYIGWDSRLSARIAIKEYFPVGFVDRRADDGCDLTVTAGNETSVFEKQKRRFIEEAKILARFLDDHAIVGVSDIISENNTAYTVMQLISGMNLAEYIKAYGKLSFDQAYGMMRPVMQSLGRVHAAGLIHRDLSPSNIMVQEDGNLILLDFGSAREYDDGDERSMSVILKPGYAPSEQYISHGAQGPWTDVYSICATIYKMITGVTPENALTRMGADTLRSPSELGAAISPVKEAALLKGLSVTRDGRYPSMDELIAALDGSADAGYVNAGYVNAGYVDNGYAEEGATKVLFTDPGPADIAQTEAEVPPPMAQLSSENVTAAHRSNRIMIVLPAVISAALVLLAGILFMTKILNNDKAAEKEEQQREEWSAEKKDSDAGSRENGSNDEGSGDVNWRGGDWTDRDDILPYMNEEGYMVFGAYEQDGDLSNGPEPIEWEVLGEDGNGTFLASRYVLDVQPYNKDDAAVTWESCSLRSWLNNEFLDQAFTPGEQAVINSVMISNPDNEYYETEGGNYTGDKIFLLSLEELIAHYSFNYWSDEFGTGDSQELIIPPTEYAKQQGVFCGVIDEDAYSGQTYEGVINLSQEGYSRDCIGREGAWWWLRKPGDYSFMGAYVSYYGSAQWRFNTLQDHDDEGVRPALYIEQ